MRSCEELWGVVWSSEELCGVVRSCVEMCRNVQNCCMSLKSFFNSPSLPWSLVLRRWMGGLWSCLHLLSIYRWCLVTISAAHYKFFHILNPCVVDTVSLERLSVRTWSNGKNRHWMWMCMFPCVSLLYQFMLFLCRLSKLNCANFQNYIFYCFPHLEVLFWGGGWGHPHPGYIFCLYTIGIRSISKLLIEVLWVPVWYGCLCLIMLYLWNLWVLWLLGLAFFSPPVAWDNLPCSFLLSSLSHSVAQLLLFAFWRLRSCEKNLSSVFHVSFWTLASFGLIWPWASDWSPRWLLVVWSCLKCTRLMLSNFNAKNECKIICQVVGWWVEGSGSNFL